MSKNVIFFIIAVAVAITLAIVLNTYLQHSARIGEIEKAVEGLKDDDPETVDKAVRNLNDDYIELWFRELTTVYDTTESAVQKRNIMKVLGIKAGLMIGERRDKVIALLEKAFDDKDDVTAATAIDVVTRDFENEGSAEKLRLIIRGGDNRIRVKMAALEGLGRVSRKDDNDDMDLLGRYLSNERAVLRMAAINGLSEIRSGKTLKAFYGRLIADDNGAPAEKNLVARSNLLFKIGIVGAEVKNENVDLCQAIEKDLEKFLRDTTFTSLYMQALVTTSNENIAEMQRYLNIDDLGEIRLTKSNKLETGVFTAALMALYRLGAGDKYSVALERMQSAETEPEGRAILEGALLNYFEFLLAPNGPDMPLSDIDRSRLLFVSRRLAGLIGEGEAISDFAQESLETITGRPDIDSKEGWQKYLGQFNESDKKFEPAGVEPE